MIYCVALRHLIILLKKRRFNKIIRSLYVINGWGILYLLFEDFYCIHYFDPTLWKYEGALLLRPFGGFFSQKRFGRFFCLKLLLEFLAVGFAYSVNNIVSYLNITNLPRGLRSKYNYSQYRTPQVVVFRIVKAEVIDTDLADEVDPLIVER